jgi:hypothetical protein
MESPSQVIWGSGWVLMVAHCAKDKKDKKRKKTVFMTRNRAENED